MDDINKQILQDVTEIKVMQGKMQITLEQNTQSLQQHMKRTDLNEQRIQMLEDSSISDRSFLRGVLWAIGGIGTGMLTLLGLYFQFAR